VSSGCSPLALMCPRHHDCTTFPSSWPVLHPVQAVLGADRLAVRYPTGSLRRLNNGQLSPTHQLGAIQQDLCTQAGNESVLAPYFGMPKYMGLSTSCTLIIVRAKSASWCSSRHNKVCQRPLCTIKHLPVAYRHTLPCIHMEVLPLAISHTWT